MLSYTRPHHFMCIYLLNSIDGHAVPVCVLRVACCAPSLCLCCLAVLPARSCAVGVLALISVH